MQAARAKIVLPALEHREAELHRQNSGEHRQVLFHELLLQIDGVRGGDGLFAVGHGEQNGRDEVANAFADAGARLDHQMLLRFERPRHSHGHLLLLRAILKILRARQQSARRKDFLDLFDQVDTGTGGLGFDNRNHFNVGQPSRLSLLGISID